MWNYPAVTICRGPGLAAVRDRASLPRWGEPLQHRHERHGRRLLCFFAVPVHQRVRVCYPAASTQRLPAALPGQLFDAGHSARLLVPFQRAGASDQS
jgi:hypothetical protein